MENWRKRGGWKHKLVDGRANLGRVPGGPQPSNSLYSRIPAMGDVVQAQPAVDLQQASDCQAALSSH